MSNRRYSRRESARQYTWKDLAGSIFYHPREPLEKRSGHWTRTAAGMVFHCWDIDYVAYGERLSACKAAARVAAAGDARRIDAAAFDELLQPLRQSNG